MVDRYEALRNTAKRDLAIDNYTTEEPRVILELLAERDALAAQVEALEKDAGRWRFLLDNLQDLRGTAEMRIGKFAVMGRIDKYRIQEFKDADEFRQTIDAAREQK